MASCIMASWGTQQRNEDKYVQIVTSDKPNPSSWWDLINAIKSADILTLNGKLRCLHLTDVP